VLVRISSLLVVLTVGTVSSTAADADAEADADAGDLA
jgi:hypothetical protein